MVGHARSALVVDDDASYRAALEAGLSALGYSVVLASDANQALRLFETRSPNIALLDLRLPGMSWSELCCQLRLRSDIPIITRSAVTEELGIVLCFELGADDYVAKPFRIRELAARMDAATRHWEAARRAKGQPTHTVEIVTVGPYVIDSAARTVELNGERVELALKEFDVLAHLARMPGRVCTREEILSDVWGIGAADKTAADQNLDVHMYRLRSKLENHPSRPKWIVTVRGIGYLLNDGRELNDRPRAAPS